jgi:hypothetical protein
MTLQLADISIDRVYIIDDDPNAREAYAYSVEDLNLQAVLAEGPLPALGEFIEHTRNSAEAAICDYKLNIRNYAAFDGAQSVTLLYQSQFPVILCTRYEIASIDEMRPYRRYIPVLLKPDELSPDNLIQGFERCIGEFRGEFRPQRRPWRTLVRVDSVDYERSNLYIVVPGWDLNQVVSLHLDDVPPIVRECVSRNQDRFHASVNIGAEGYEDLYFEAWETD